MVDSALCSDEFRGASWSAWRVVMMGLDVPVEIPEPPEALAYLDKYCRVCGAFLTALAEDFEQFGRAAIVACREQSPARYLAIVATLLPKEFTLESEPPLAHLTNEDIADIIRFLENDKTVAAAVGWKSWARASDDPNPDGGDN
jgi:hypothetical protein